MLFREKFSLEFKAMLQESNFLPTSHATMTNKKPYKLQKGCHMLATFFATCNSILPEWANQNSSFARGRFPPSCLLLCALQIAKKVANMWHPFCNLNVSLFVIVACKAARKIDFCSMALNFSENFAWNNIEGETRCLCKWATCTRFHKHLQTRSTDRNNEGKNVRERVMTRTRCR